MASGAGYIKQGTLPSTIANVGMQYKGQSNFFGTLYTEPLPDFIVIHSTKCIRFDYLHPVIINESVLSYDMKNIEDVTKNINMFAQLHSAIFTAFFTDPLSAGMVYKRVGASW
jgi:hypothetical protein